MTNFTERDSTIRDLTIRAATPDDAVAISALIAPLLPLLTIEPDGAGAEKFIATMQAPAIARVLSDDRYDYLLGHVGDQLVGVAGQGLRQAVMACAPRARPAG